MYLCKINGRPFFLSIFILHCVFFAILHNSLKSFIPAFKEAPYSKRNNWHYLIGNFNLGGTVSGRLSSSKPNMQQLPATGSKYAKIIKSCFQAPKGWILCGLDYSSLEDRISALTTKDPEKLKIYELGLDSHAYRALHFFPEKIPDINLAKENDICYSAIVKGKQICFTANDVITIEGKKYTGQEIYEMVAN